jgi:hypothetical protein
MKFDFDRHFGVFVGTSPNSLFRLNVSPLDGTDVLANDAQPLIEYVDFTHLVTEVQVSNGVSAIGTTIDLGAKTGTIILVAQDADPLDGYFVKVSSPIKLVLTGYPSGGSDTDWFYGFVKAIERDTDSNGLNRVVLHIGDQIEQLMNFEATIYRGVDSTFEMRWEDIEAVSQQTIDFANTGGGFTFPTIDIFEVPLADTILETMQGELGWLITTRFNAITPISHTVLESRLAGSHDYEINESLTGTKIRPTYLNQSASSESLISTINAALTWDPATVVSVTDQDQADLYGNSTLDIEVMLADETNLTAWANYAITLTGQQNIKALSVDGINHRNAQLFNVYEMEPGECVLVNVQSGATQINENYLISKVTHMITPNTWQTDLELWRN